MSNVQGVSGYMLNSKGVELHYLQIGFRGDAKGFSRSGRYLYNNHFKTTYPPLLSQLSIYIYMYIILHICLESCGPKDSSTKAIKMIQNLSSYSSILGWEIAAFWDAMRSPSFITAVDILKSKELLTTITTACYMHLGRHPGDVGIFTSRDVYVVKVVSVNTIRLVGVQSVHPGNSEPTQKCDVFFFIDISWVG